MKKYKNFALINALMSVVVLTSCASETYLEPEPTVEKEIIENNTNKEKTNDLVYSKVSLSRNNATINLSVTLSEKQVTVNEFSIPTSSNAEGTEYDFNDGQHATVNHSGTDVSNVRLAHIDTISEGDRLKVTPHFIVDYALNGVELADTLSPWYYQVVPVIDPNPEVADVVKYIPTTSLINNNDGSVNFALKVIKTINGVEVKKWSMNKVIARVGDVRGSEYYVINTQYSQEKGIKNETSTTTATGTEKAFTLTTEKKTYYWNTYFNGTAGKVDSKNEILFTVVTSVVFTDGEYKLEYNFSGNTTATQNEVVDKGYEGKYVNGESEISPYLGTYVLKVESEIYSPQVTDLNNTVFHSSTAENNLYQR